jgi:LacI family transcriptional regulator
MSKKQIRLADLAEQLGLSTATVSRALKDYPDISAETKRRVLELAKALNYRPNSIAAGLRQQETRMIGVIIPEIVNHFFAKVIKGIMEVAYKEGYKVMLCQSDEDYEKEVKDARALLSSRVDGLMASLGNHTHDFEHFFDFQRAGVPIVFFDKTAPEIEGFSQVVIDDYRGAFSAVEHLIGQGCRRIAHLSGPQEAFTFQRRFQGYRDALQKHGLPLDPALVCECPRMSHELARDCALRLLEQQPPIDGLFAVTDLLAIGAIKGLREQGKKCPEDIAVVGFSNWELGTAIDPPLSSVDQPGYEMGKQATEILLREIRAEKEEESLPPEKVILNTGLQIRASSLRR